MALVKYIWDARVISVNEHKTTIWKGGVGAAAIMEEVSSGWYVRVTESSAIHVGSEKPDLLPGDTVELTMIKKAMPPR